jgi:aminomethyltransferase
MTITVAERSRLLMPGMANFEPGVERYRVTGGAVTAVLMGAGDKLEIIDPEGCQPVEVAAFDRDGKSDPGLLGHSSGAPATGIAAILAGNQHDASRVADALAAKGIDLGATTAIHCFSQDSAAAETVWMTASADVVCVIGVPGGDMSPEEQNTPTDVIAFIHRTAPPAPGLEILPTPLADQNQDLRIRAATARAYEVKAGEFIQVIDVEGRECSDFQCFDAARLEDGVEAALDATTTRSLMGASYPMPGLYAKYFTHDFQPMVEIIHDTVGRHDTFNTACNAKYYEEIGYPGHINCSDNFNSVLDPYGIAPRRGWEAINFFYNTNLDDSNQLFFEEPWSRPGDYVLLEALTDLICVSSACPCDVDAANGWQPTDIHVRVYPATSTFKKATAFRMSTDADPELTKETGFHPRTSALTRNFTEYNGYWLANSYTNHGPIDEYWATREKAGIIDLSPLRKYEVTGPDAELLLQTCMTRNIRKLAVSQIVYTAMCYDTGGMIDDGTLFRLGPDNFRWIGGSDASGLWLRRQAKELGLHAWVRDSTDQLHNVQVQGPLSREILSEVIWTRPDQASVEELGWFRLSIARIGHSDGIPIIVSRTGYTGELGFEVFCHPSGAPEVWDAIWEAGEPKGLMPLGLEALDMLRVEAGLVFAGAEFCDQTNPFEAGIGFTVPLKTKEDDFIGRDALVRAKEHPQRVLVGLDLVGDDLVGTGDPVMIDRQQVGTITSGVRSPILRKNIALCRMSIEHSEIGTEVEVGKMDGHQKRLPATVVRFPHYDPDKERVRS